MCGQCRDNLEENTCPTCRQPLIAVRNLAVEQVVEALPKECPNVDHGCQELLDADAVDTHKVTCPFRQFSCPRPPCSWTGYKPELIGHMRDTHPQHVIFSTKQTVKVPVMWDDVSSWTMFVEDQILVLKFSVERATNFLLGSFECLGQLNPVESITYHMTVKSGNRETTLSGNIAPEMNATDRQCLKKWDNVFPPSRYDDHPESDSSTSSRYINVDVAIEDNRVFVVAQASGDVEVQTQASDDDEVQTQTSDDDEVWTQASDDDEVWTQAHDDFEVQSQISNDVEVQNQASVDVGVQNQASVDVEVGVGDEAGGDTTRQVGVKNQSDQTADRVIQKLGSWLDSGCYNHSVKFMASINSIIIKTQKNITSGLFESINDISDLIITNYTENYPHTEMYLYYMFQCWETTNVKMEHLRAAGGRHFNQRWLLPYLFVVEQIVYQAFLKYVHEFPDIDYLEQEKLLTVRRRQMCDESALRMLRWAHVSGGQQRVENLIWRMGRVHKKSEEEISSLLSDAATIPWKDITSISNLN